MQSNENGRLTGLTEISYEQLQEGAPDIGGWDVITEDGAKLGEVHCLIGDPIERRVRYIDVDLDGDVIDSDAGTHLLTPIGKVELDTKEERVIIRSLGTQDVRKVPSYNHGELTREYEDSLRTAYEPSYNPASSIDDVDYYQGSLYDDTELYRSRGRV